MMRTFLQLLVLLLLPQLVVCDNKYDQDTAKDCQEKADEEYCTKDPQTYFECPITCAQHMRPQAAAWGGFEKKETPFYSFKMEDINGKVVDFEDFDGDIVLVAMVPMFPGLAQFHYELLQHVLDVYKYVVEVVVIPMQGQDGVTIEPKTGSSIRILEGVNDGNHKVVRYLSKFIQEGKFDPSLLNTFIVSGLGNRITLHISPDMKTYRKFLDDELKEMETEL